MSLAQFDERQLYEELLVGGSAIVEVGFVAKRHCFIEELGRALLGTLSHFGFHLVAGFEQRQR
jgi:hypothetical protein